MGAIMTRAGLLVDLPYVETLRAKLTAEEEEHAARAARYGVTSVNSTAQVAEALAAMGETLSERTDSGNVKVDKAVLLGLADLDRDWKRVGAREPNPLADAVIRSKRASKWRVAYADKFATAADARGYIHPSINTLAARTGRMSVNGDLAAQTLPSSDWTIRRAILADEGHVMVSTDFAAVELRMLAALADVRRMKAAIAAGEDLHSFTARLVFGPDFTKAHRKVSKAIAFGTVYGGGATTIQRQTGAPMAEVKNALAAYFRTYPEIRRASQRWQREALATGAVAISVTGRRLPVDRKRLYATTNHLIQSAARDCLGQAMLNCEKAGLLPYLKMPLHDELLASVPVAQAPDFAREIERAMGMTINGVKIDAEAETGKQSWGSLYGSDF